MQKSHSTSLYQPEEHDACGVGFLANLSATPSHKIVENAILALGRMAHRGGSGFGPEHPDGAGLLMPLPISFLSKVWEPACGTLPQLFAVGQFFMPHQQEARSSIKEVAEQIFARHGLILRGWREVPVRKNILGEHGAKSCPVFRQCLLEPGELLQAELTHKEPEYRLGSSTAERFERILYIARRHLENYVRTALPEAAHSFHVASLSASSIVYKGLLAGGDLGSFYPDLADPDFKVHFAVLHERYSTNTQPAWHLAQPFHCLAHNGEINTLSCNKMHMAIREPVLASPLFGDNIKHILPILNPHGSDSAALDNTLEFLHHAGRSLSHAAMMLMPEPFGASFAMGEDKRAFYEYHASIMEPWDGPSALVFTDGRQQLGAMLDRNALRPCRYAQTKDGMFVLASEAGVLNLPEGNILYKGRLKPRQMLMVDFARHRVITDAECKGRVIYAKPYRHWVREHGITLRDLPLPPSTDCRTPENTKNITQRQILFGYSKEDINNILLPMARDAQEPIGSMGIDRPLAVLSSRPQLLFSYFKQRFAQVTNPPIDPLREGLVMTLTGFAGKQGNILEETAQHYNCLRLSNPLLMAEDIARLTASSLPAVQLVKIPILFNAKSNNPGKELEEALEGIFHAAEAALNPATGNPATLLLLTDAGADQGKAPIPSLLATSALHHHLLRLGKRHTCSLLVDTGEAREVMHIAQLIAFGASAVYPRLAFATVRTLAANGQLNAISPESACTAYANAIHKGLLKTFSRMGISTLRSFMGGQGFEAIGLRAKLMEKYFTGVPSRLGGVGLEGIAIEACARHAEAFACTSNTFKPEVMLKADGRYKPTPQGEYHLWTPLAIRSLHKAVRDKDFTSYQSYAKESDERVDKPVTLRNLLQFSSNLTPIDINEVEPAESIIKRFVASAMSYGSISPEAHRAIAIACNRTGARSNCGEGGESEERNKIQADGSDARSRVRQIASGRFGVTASYIINADEIQIKMAQGAKPGEGGQLPAHKVSSDIAAVRHTIAGVTLISPPPHHDIYSIEDLAQLIYDIKILNPKASVSVKLVAGSGIGTVASGVAKAGADIILVSGHDGGTGASPRSAVDHVGLPWELGLSETQAALCAAGLRENVRLQVDGQLRTGKDLTIAALMGAEEFGLGTSVLVALGCCLLRVCHLGTCSKGIAASDPKLRSRFEGTPEHIEQFFHFLAEDMRQHMARLGFRSVDEMIGRADLLEAAPIPAGLTPEHDLKLRSLVISPLLVSTSLDNTANTKTKLKPHQATESPLHKALSEALMPSITARRTCRFSGAISNTDRAIGSRLAGEISKLYGVQGLPKGCVEIDLTGSAGQSLGAFLVPGIFLRVTGEANDYVGKGLSGGVIALRPKAKTINEHTVNTLSTEQVIAGNVALYGATSGEAYFAGSAGERFAVRNSGAMAVVEGVGDHACEYMTGGVVVVLGSTGYNFAAGMSGGTAYVYDPSEQFQMRCNMDSIDIESVWRKDDVLLLRSLLVRHERHTGSPFASALLKDWQSHLPLFLKVTPIEYRRALERMKQAEGRQVENLAPTEEVYTKVIHKESHHA